MGVLIRYVCTIHHGMGLGIIAPHSKAVSHSVMEEVAWVVIRSVGT